MIVKIERKEKQSIKFNSFFGNNFSGQKTRSIALMYANESLMAKSPGEKP